ncbi:ATP-binding protein, partial [Escherichia coli]
MNHLYEQLTALKLTGFRDALKKQLAQPGTYQELGFEERLSLLTAEELTCRENRKAERLIKHARFRLNAELSKLDYRNNRGLDRALIRSLSQGNWLTLKQNILLTGATGSGKTFLACALGHNACRLNRPGFPGECFICELRLPDHRFRWKHNKLFLLL